MHLGKRSGNLRVGERMNLWHCALRGELLQSVTLAVALGFLGRTDELAAIDGFLAGLSGDRRLLVSGVRGGGRPGGSDRTRDPVAPLSPRYTRLRGVQSPW
jgi:hypothetical protein